jgi:hypothetical protein
MLFRVAVEEGTAVEKLDVLLSIAKEFEFGEIKVGARDRKVASSSSVGISTCVECVALMELRRTPFLNFSKAIGPSAACGGGGSTSRKDAAKIGSFSFVPKIVLRFQSSIQLIAEVMSSFSLLKRKHLSIGVEVACHFFVCAC